MKFASNNATHKINLIIGDVQSGKTKFMINKTQKFLDSDTSFVIILTGNTIALKQQTQERFVWAQSYPIKEVSELVQLNINPSSINKTVIFSLKGKSDLEKLKSFLNEGDLTTKKIVIFDDESDYASLNTSKLGQSVLFSLISWIIKRCYNLEFYSVTATPYGNLMSSKSLEYQSIKYLVPNKGYTGLEFFEKNKLYTNIDTSKELNYEQTIKNSVFQFLAMASYKHMQTQRNSEMLVNVDNLNIKNIEIAQMIKKSINSVVDLTTQKVQELFFQHISKKYKINQEEYFESVAKILNYIYKNNIIYTFISGGHNYQSDVSLVSIVIGSTLVSRGFTFKELVLCILLNLPQDKIAVDTLLQRARWLGYRKDIYEYMQIMINHKTWKALREATYINNKIKKLVKQGLHAQQIRKIIAQDQFEFIIPTSKEKSQ